MGLKARSKAINEQEKPVTKLFKKAKMRTTSEVELTSLEGAMSLHEINDLAIDAKSFLEEAAERAGVEINLSVVYNRARVIRGDQISTEYTGVKVMADKKLPVYSDLVDKYTTHWNQTYEIVPQK